MTSPFETLAISPRSFKRLLEYVVGAAMTAKLASELSLDD